MKKNPSSTGKIIRSCDGFFSCAVVVPMLNENSNASAFFASLKKAAANAANEKILIITVVNRHADSPREYIIDNEHLLQRLNSNEFQLANLAVIDCTSDGMTLKNGVGEARKKGMDCALNFFDLNDFENSIIFSLDADTFVDENYFTAIRDKMNCNMQYGALTFNVKHQSDAVSSDALQQYEFYLRSYYEGLKSADSPFAFYTVGSAFACRAANYIKAGGMRKLKAGEDFYFLQSIAKSSKVLHCPEITVHPSARFSPRVPFGTGTALQAIAENQKEYAPFPATSFEALKNLLTLASNPQNLASAENFLSHLPNDFQAFFEQHDFISDWEKVIKNIPHAQLPDAFKLHWFDALKTLQFIKFINKKSCTP